MIWGYPYFWKHPYICIYIYFFFTYLYMSNHDLIYVIHTDMAGVKYEMRELITKYRPTTRSHIWYAYLCTRMHVLSFAYIHIYIIYIYLYIIYIWILYRHSRSLPRPGRDWMKGQNFEVKCVNKKLSWLETELTNLPIVDTAGLLRRWVLCLEELKARAPCMDDSFEQRSFSTTTEQTF